MTKLIIIFISFKLVITHLNIYLTPPFSKACNAAIVDPPADVTISFSSPVCFPVCKTIRLPPDIPLAAKRTAKSRGRPCFTPPSANASIMRKA